MLIILKPNVDHNSECYKQLIDHCEGLTDVEYRVHNIQGTQQMLSEIYLLGDTANVDSEIIKVWPCVDRVVKISNTYRVLGRHEYHDRKNGFTYKGLQFGQNSFHLFPGLCAVDNQKHVEQMMEALANRGISCTRMGAYKPRTNPYSFQGHGEKCLPYVFQAADKYGIKVIAMEVTHENHIKEIKNALQKTNSNVGVILQIGTRNSQNFELLKAVGRQKEFPVLFKRGFGITLEESFNAAEYLASEGNDMVIFGLRGMKSVLGDPHRNFVDFAQVSVVKRLTRMPVCIDPSHSVGTRDADPQGILDIFNVASQGIITGANMVLVDFHPHPPSALVDGPQALRLEELDWFIKDMQIARKAYLDRKELARMSNM